MITAKPKCSYGFSKLTSLCFLEFHRQLAINTLVQKAPSSHGDSQSVVLGPAALASPDSWLEMQILRPHPIRTHPGTLGMMPNNSLF